MPDVTYQGAHVHRIDVLDPFGGTSSELDRVLAPLAVRLRRITSWVEASELVQADPPDLLVLSMCLPADMDYDAFPDSGNGRTPPILVLAGCTATELIGKMLFPTARILPFPVASEVLRHACRSMLDGHSHGTPETIDGIVGQSPGMQRVHSALAQVADADTTVLLVGETGTGKELVARKIHELSPRSRAPFIAINCIGLADGILESELFGHAQGAFTGARKGRAGLFEAAAGGTVLLDEIADAPDRVQARLLRVLQEREVRRVGESRPRSLDVRIIAASQRDLDGEVAAGRLRKDLYYRLKVFTITLPPLRDRKADLPLLVEHWLKGRGEGSVTPAAVRALQAHHWPGNVRELWAVLEASAIRAAGVPIGPEHLDLEIREAWIEAIRSAFRMGSGDASLDPLREALEAVGGNRTKAAKLLGVSRTTLWRKLKDREGAPC